MPEARRLRVLWLMKELSIGGAERLLIEINRYTDDIQFQPLAIGSGDRSLEPELVSEGLSPLVLPTRHELDVRWLVHLRRIVRDLRPDIVHLNNPYVAAVARTALFRRAFPLISTEHSVWPSYHPVSRWANAITLRANDRVVAVSEQVRTSILASPLGRRMRGKVRVIPNGIDVQRVVSDADRTVHAVELPHPSYGTVGHLRLTKGIDVLLRAARDIRQMLPAAAGFVVGEGEDRPLLERQRDELQADLTFLGLRVDARAIMRRLDVFVIASRVDGLPLALLEAMSLGKPIVSTRAGGIPDVLTDRHDALLVPVEDPNALAGAIVEVLTNEELASTLGANARHTVERYDVRETAASYEGMYRELTA